MTAVPCPQLTNDCVTLLQIAPPPFPLPLSHILSSLSEAQQGSGR